MDTSLLDPTRPQTREESRCWHLLLAARGGCAFAALVAASSLRPLVALPVLVVLAGIVVGVEGMYRSALQRLRHRRQRMALEAERERQFRAIRQAQRAAAEKYFDERCLVLRRTPAVLPDEPSRRGSY